MFWNGWDHGPLTQKFYFTLFFSWKLQVTQVLSGFFSPLSAANKIDLCERWTIEQKWYDQMCFYCSCDVGDNYESSCQSYHEEFDWNSQEHSFYWNLRWRNNFFSIKLLVLISKAVFNFLNTANHNLKERIWRRETQNHYNKFHNMVQNLWDGCTETFSLGYRKLMMSPQHAWIKKSHHQKLWDEENIIKGLS